MRIGLTGVGRIAALHASALNRLPGISGRGFQLLPRRAFGGPR